MNDRFVEGSDCEGFFVAKDRAALRRGKTLMDAYVARLGAEDPDDDTEMWDALIDTLGDAGVYEIMQDWKHLHDAGDIEVMRALGVRVTSKTVVSDADERDVYAYTVSRITARSLRQRLDDPVVALDANHGRRR